MSNNPNLQAKTLEEHRQYLYEIVRLKLFFLHLWLEQHPEEDFQFVIRNRVDIYRKTKANPGLHTPKELFFDAPAWKSMEDLAEQCWKENRNDRERFEKEAFEIFRDSIDQRCEFDYLDNSVLAQYTNGCLRHDRCPDETNPELIWFHIGNVLRPHSIFEDPDYLPRCFKWLMDTVEEKFNVKQIGTGTWLNSNPKWLALFPDEWLENLSAPVEAINWSYGCWGQFISARGTFNAKHGRILRETGRFPFYARISHCSIAAMRKKHGL